MTSPSRRNRPTTRPNSVRSNPTRTASCGTKPPRASRWAAALALGLTLLGGAAEAEYFDPFAADEAARGSGSTAAAVTAAAAPQRDPFDGREFAASPMSRDAAAPRPPQPELVAAPLYVARRVDDAVPEDPFEGLDAEPVPEPENRSIFSNGGHDDSAEEAEEAPAPAEESAPPAEQQEESLEPATQTPAPAEDAPAPADEPAAPVEESPAPAEESTLVPFEPEPLVPQEDESPAEPKQESPRSAADEVIRGDAQAEGEPTPDVDAEQLFEELVPPAAEPELQPQDDGIQSEIVGPEAAEESPALELEPPAEDSQEEDRWQREYGGQAADDKRPEPTPQQRAERQRQIEKERQKSEDACREIYDAVRNDRITNVDLDIALPGSAGEDYPFDCQLGAESFSPRSWSTITYRWKASGLCHKPLYFQEVQLERYGHTWGPVLQPFVSGAHFFVTVPALPYAMGLQTPNECVYTLGYYRPGSCAPRMIEAIPFTWRAAAFQAGAATGMSFIFP